jgi:hypothetical protein
MMIGDLVIAAGPFICRRNSVSLLKRDLFQILFSINEIQLFEISAKHFPPAELAATTPPFLNQTKML